MSTRSSLDSIWTPSFGSEVGAAGGDRGRKTRYHVLIIDLTIELGLRRMYPPGVGSGATSTRLFPPQISSAPDVVCLVSMMSVAPQVRRDSCSLDAVRAHQNSVERVD